jgi:hypothetical protein
MHITKDDFFPAFQAAFEVVFVKQNVKGSFQGAGLVPFNLDAVILKLDVKLWMLTPPRTSNGLP